MWLYGYLATFRSNQDEHQGAPQGQRSTAHTTTDRRAPGRAPGRAMQRDPHPYGGGHTRREHPTRRTNRRLMLCDIAIFEDLK